MWAQESLTCEAASGEDRTDLKRRNVTEAFYAPQCQECWPWSSLDDGDYDGRWYAKWGGWHWASWASAPSCSFLNQDVGIWPISWWQLLWNCVDKSFEDGSVRGSVGQCLECCSQLAGLSQLWQGLLWALDGSLKDGNNHYCHWQQSSYQAVWHHYRGLCSVQCAVHIVWMVGVIFARGKLHRRGKDSLLLKLQELFRRKHLPDISLPESWLLLIDLRTIFWICRPKINIFWPGKRDGSSMSLWGHCPPAYHQMYPMSPSLHCRLIIWRVPHTCPLQFHPLRRHFTSSGFSSQLMSFRPVSNFNVRSVWGERMQKGH